MLGKNPASSILKTASKKLSMLATPKIGYEVVDPNAEPPLEEIEEYAKRIGIDIETEPQLLNLAREGLKQRLPDKWKPCFEPLRNLWYYYNTETLSSQWEHPLDEVYREKVRVARVHLGMDRNQNFDPKKSKPPLKSLPPLKKGFGGTSTFLKDKPDSLFPQHFPSQSPAPPVPAPPIKSLHHHERGDLLPDSNAILKKKHEEIEMLKENHKSLMESLESQLKAEEEELNQQHDKILRDMRINLSNEKKKFIDSLRAQKESEISELQKTYDDMKLSIQKDIDQLKNNDLSVKFKEEMEKAKREHRESMDSLAVHFKNDETKLRQEQAKLLNELKSSFLIEKDNLIKDLKLQRDEEISNLKKDYDLLKETLNRQISEAKKQTEVMTVTVAQMNSSQQTDPDPITLIKKFPDPEPEKTQHDSENNNILFTRVPSLEAKEIELKTIKTKYEQLQEKYDGLKMELKAVVNFGQKKLGEGIKDKQDLSQVDSQSGITSKDEGLHDSKTGEFEEHNSFNLPVEQSNSTLHIDDMIVGSNLRLNKALSALEVLRDQILTINDGEERNAELIKPTKSKSDEARQRKHNKRSDRALRPTSSDNFEAHHQIVAEAKDFIKAQKQRLMNRPSSDNNFDSTRNPYFVLQGSDIQETNRKIADLSQKLGYYNTSIPFGRNSSNKDVLISETESSGFGSQTTWKRGFDNQSPETKTQVAKDIDGILVSLKKLDDQMKSLWSMVGQEQETQQQQQVVGSQNLFKPLIHKMSPNAMAHLNYMTKSGNVEPFNRYNYSKNFVNPQTINARYNLVNNTRPVQSTEFYGNYGSGTTTTGDGIGYSSWIQGELKPENQPMMYTTNNMGPTTNSSDLSESLFNKTKDLRDWLEKF